MARKTNGWVVAALAAAGVAAAVAMNSGRNSTADCSAGRFAAPAASTSGTPAAFVPAPQFPDRQFDDRVREESNHNVVEYSDLPSGLN